MKLRSKLIVFLTVLAMIIGNVAVLSFAADGTETLYEAEIMSVKGGADAIATLTFDDGKHDTVTKLLPLLEKNGVKASLMVVPSRIEGIPPYDSGYSTVLQLNEVLSSGYVDIQSHSYSHLYMHDTGDDAVNNTPANIEAEIPASKTYLEGKFPSQDVISIAVPGGKYSTEATNRMMEVFYSARKTNGGAYDSKTGVYNVQSLTPADNASDGGWYNPYCLWLNQNNETVINTYLGMCVEEGGWFIVGAHNFAGSDADVNQGKLRDFTKEWLDSFLASLKEREDKGELWIATMGEATKYLREVENSSVKEYATDEGLFVELTMSKTTARGMALSSDVFNMPLTVRVEIPEGWAKVRCSVGGTDSIVQSFTEGEKTYAYLDLVPNGKRAYLTDADKEIPKTKINAEIMNARGGADAIATMTFDDGLMPTAELLNELLAEYGLEASLMLITDTIGASNGYTVSEWNSIFEKGYLEPQSHSSGHKKITSGTPDTNTDEIIEEEIVGSYNDLKSYFPSYDPITFAVPYSNYSKEAKAVLMNTYYAVRMGTCVLSQQPGKMQSLNPAHSASNGGWYNPYIARMQPLNNEAVTVQGIIDYLSVCVNNGGWFQGFAHGIAAEGVTLTNSHDLTEEQARQIFSSMKSYVDQGRLWVASFSEATKYIRELQNSTVEAYTTVNGMYVSVTMSEATAEGLPLSSDVFNTPLTVKVQLPGNWGKITYTQDGLSTEAYSFKESGLNFAYIDVVPNGGTVSISNAGDPTEYVESLGIKENVSIDSSVSLNVYIPTDSYVTTVKNGNAVMEGKEVDGGYTAYTVDNIFVTEVTKKYTFTLSFDGETGYGDYTMTLSCTSYLEELAGSESTSDKDKQLIYDFTVFAKASCIKFSGKGGAADLSMYDAILDKLDGFTASADSYGTPPELGTLTNVVDSVAFTVNEKPYYVFFIKEGFTGALNISVGEGESEESLTYNIVNGYYHCQRYVIYEIGGVFDLMSELGISAEGKIGDSSVSAEGCYSLDSYAEGLSEGGVMPEYVAALYSYAVSARDYRDEQ